jgi:hypothetical protein
MSAAGQDFNKYRIGFKIEPNMSWFTPKEKYLEATDNKIRFSYGLITDIHFTENYAIGTGLNIITNGGEVSYKKQIFEGNTEYVIATERDMSLKYVEIPLTLKMRTNEIGYITYWGQFGVGLGIKVDARMDESYSYELELADQGWEEITSKQPVSDENINISSSIKPMRASLIIGAGIEYSISGTTAIVAGINFNNGFTNVLKGEGLKTDNVDKVIFEEGQPQSYDLNSISNSFGLTIGILF